MGVIKVRHMPGDDLRSEKGSKRTYTRVLVAECSDPAANNLEVLSDPKIPQELAPDPWDSGCTIVARTAKRRGKSLIHWDITLTSTTEIEGSGISNPLEAPAQWETQTVLYEVPVLRDRDKKLITNTAGDLIEGGKDFILGFTFTAYFSLPDIPLNWIKDFGNTLNDAPVTIRGIRCDKETVWLKHLMVGKPQREFSVTHCPSSATFEYRPDGWDYNPLNRGFREIVQWKEKNKHGATIRRGVMIEARDEKGDAYREPVFLDRDGAQYRVQNSSGVWQLKNPLEAADIIVLKFNVKKTSSFRVLTFLR